MPFVCEATSRSFHGIALDRLRWDRHAGLVGELCSRLAFYNNSLGDKTIYSESGEERDLNGKFGTVGLNVIELGITNTTCFRQSLSVKGCMSRISSHHVDNTSFLNALQLKTVGN